MRWLALALLPAMAAAEEGEFVPGPYIEVLAECYGSAATQAERTACIGEITATCEEEEPRGQTTLGMVACAGIEADAWDIVLEGELQLTSEWARQADAEDPAGEDLTSRVEALRASQRAWSDYVDAECLRAFAWWGSGSMRQVAGAQCRRDRIAERAVALRGMREEG